MINRDRVRLLVNDLRKGPNRQGTGCLARVAPGKPPEYCCLGRAAEVYLANGGTLSKETSPTGIVSYGDRDGLLPAEVAEWYGFDSPNPVVHILVGSHELTVNLAEMNDGIFSADFPEYEGRKFKFRQIADAIENTFLR